MPRGIPNKRIDSTELDTEQKSHVDMPASGALDRKALSQEIEVAPAMALDSYAAELAFMEESLDVEVHESTDLHAEPIVDVYCNGVPQRFVRGQVQTVKRKFVQILAATRPTAIRTEVIVQGDKAINRVSKHTALRYPFSVVRDDNPRGRTWLRNLLQRT